MIQALPEHTPVTRRIHVSVTVARLYRYPHEAAIESSSSSLLSRLSQRLEFADVCAR